MAMFSRKPKKSKKKKDKPVVEAVSVEEETVDDVPVVESVDEVSPEPPSKQPDGAPDASKVRLVYETHTAMVYVIKQEFIAEIGAKKVTVLKEGHRPTA